jgi:hypothetical protein
MDQVEELRVELTQVRAENMRLRLRAVEERQFAEERLELAVGLAKDVDTVALEAQIRELQRTIEENDAVIDRICVFLRRRG